jgi:hypothetical protein
MCCRSSHSVSPRSSNVMCPRTPNSRRTTRDPETGLSGVSARSLYGAIFDLELTAHHLPTLDASTQAYGAGPEPEDITL